MARPRARRPSQRDLWSETLALIGDPEADLTRYRERPTEFLTEVLGCRPWAKQEEALARLAQGAQLTIRSSHGVGKTYLAAAAALWWTYSHRPSLVLTTAPTARQVESLLWSEINRLWAKALLPLPGRCLNTRLDAGIDQQATGLTTTEPERFAGWHCENMLVIVDEASGVPDSLFEVLQGTLTSANCKLLLIGNPTRPEGYFARSHRQWKPAEKAHLSSFDCPNLTCPPDEPPPCPWLVTREWVEARRQEWGEDSDAWRVRVMGEFPAIGDNTLIALEWVEAATRESEGADGARVMALDVARYGSSETVAAIRQGDRLETMISWRGMDLMATAGRAIALAKEHRCPTLIVDAVGVGGGVVDRLNEAVADDPHLHRQLHIEPFQSGERATEPERFRSKRDEAFWSLRERYRQGEITQSQEWSALTGQLTALRYGYTGRGQIAIETKDQLKARGQRSPDWADAAAMAFSSPGGGFSMPAALGQTRR